LTQTICCFSNDGQTCNKKPPDGDPSNNTEANEKMAGKKNMYKISANVCKGTPL